VIFLKIGDLEFPEDLYYYPEHHIWLKQEEDKVKVGMDAFGQKIAGKILFVRLRPAGKATNVGKTFGTLLMMILTAKDGFFSLSPHL